ncbi:2OG-Fe(II) oxygenase [Flocculibacter collagenilyticus]|uniref:2OG-Fe(II) oxygenase n=1 Tax=Flocculibacter collagenilyticus TaxID=2744479 RepID=UPI0018F4F8E6|nr:2OG-Fe(II) oxygenase [Flocculibacter collagenilyticus]
MTDFIEVYPEWMNKQYCQLLIEKFNHSSEKGAGHTGQGIDLKKKNSTDLMINLSEHWQQESAAIMDLTFKGLIPYVRKYPFLLVGAVSASFMDPNTKEVTEITHQHVQQMPNDQILYLLKHIYRLGNINLQHYKKGQGGYHHWHSEHFPHPVDKQQDSLHRTLVFMYYLNDVQEGGGTEFYFQNRSVKPEAGSLVIFPTSFTHTHKGSIPISNDKYILTSWVMFNPAQKLYGTNS